MGNYDVCNLSKFFFYIVNAYKNRNECTSIHNSLEWPAARLFFFFLFFSIESMHRIHAWKHKITMQLYYLIEIANINAIRCNEFTWKDREGQTERMREKKRSEKKYTMLMCVVVFFFLFLVLLWRPNHTQSTCTLGENSQTSHSTWIKLQHTVIKCERVRNVKTFAPLWKCLQRKQNNNNAFMFLVFFFHILHTPIFFLSHNVCTFFFSLVCHIENENECVYRIECLVPIRKSFRWNEIVFPLWNTIGMLGHFIYGIGFCVPPLRNLKQFQLHFLV